MPNNRKLLLSLRGGFEQLGLFDGTKLSILREDACMIIERVFGEKSSYCERLSKIPFSPPPGPVAVVSSRGMRGGYPSQREDPTRRQARERTWLSGQQQSAALIDTMIKDLELREEEQAESVREAGAAAAKSNRVFVVHGHDDGMRESVARTLLKLGLEPVILHEQPDRGRTIIEKFYDYSDVGFAVVLLSPDDMGYVGTADSTEARPRARQNVILELGFFLGRLGRENVVALHKGGTEIPSDFSGVLFKPFVSGGDWPYKLTKELRASGYDVSSDDL
jgi:predicted nucleotide-binding protein